MEFSEKEQEKKKITEVKTFSVPYGLEEIKENINVNTKTPSKPSKEQIRNQAFRFHSQGNISEAVKLYQYFIQQDFNDHRVFANYGVILKNLGKLQEAEISTRKAIELNPNFAKAHTNLGLILKDLDRLQEAELLLRKSIELNPNDPMAHSNLGSLFQELDKIDESILCYEAAIDLDKNLDSAIEGLGRALLKKGNHSDAIIKLRESIGSIGFNPEQCSITIY